jgi:double-stranded uracil-DNA glycosylase
VTPPRPDATSPPHRPPGPDAASPAHRPPGSDAVSPAHRPPGSDAVSPAHRPSAPRTVNRARRPTPDELAAAADRTIPDVVGPGLRVLFSGINPGLYSAATGLHFARPGNRFWPALHRSGFTERLLDPSEQDELPPLGLGISNVAARATARADELTRAELVEGGAKLAALAERWQPRLLAILGVTAYRVAFARPKATIGPQPERLGGVGVWVLPNPSGLNAHFQLDRLAEEFARVRRAADEQEREGNG